MNDLVSRQQAVAGVENLRLASWEKYHDTRLSPNDVIRMIGELPPTPSEVIIPDNSVNLCDSCKHTFNRPHFDKA